MEIVIDERAGFCTGVTTAVKMAEAELNKSGELYCLGNIVHNPAELTRLQGEGLKIIDYNKYRTLKNTRVLIRAHGEPPHVFTTALENNLELLNATCPIVKRLQNRVTEVLSVAIPQEGTILIFGKNEHPEVVALSGIAGGKVTVVRNIDEIKNISLDKPIFLFAQTTMNRDEYGMFAEELRKLIVDSDGDPDSMLHVHQTICGEVACRVPGIQEFAIQFDLVLFVSGKESSNGRMLFQACREANSNSCFVSDIKDLEQINVANATSIGISGATSTPPWLLVKVKESVKGLVEKNQ